MSTYQKTIKIQEVLTGQLIDRVKIRIALKDMPIRKNLKHTYGRIYGE